MAEGNQDRGDDWVRLVSNDGHSFLVRRKVAMVSGTLKDMLSTEANFAEAAANTCPVQERAIVTEKLCEYMQYKSTYENVPPKEDIPDFSERIPPEIVLELLTTADYFDGESLVVSISRFILTLRTSMNLYSRDNFCLEYDRAAHYLPSAETYAPDGYRLHSMYAE
ncbi:BTB/POZ protein [Irpex lacteus]|nr:BTB/POZ protein [Irpex lacteus]